MNEKKKQRLQSKTIPTAQLELVRGGDGAGVFAVTHDKAEAGSENVKRVN